MVKPHTLEFTEPPPDPRGLPRGTYDWAAIAADLKAKPGEWAKLYDEGPVTLANSLRQGHNQFMRAEDGFQTLQRNTRKVTDPNTGRQVRTCSLFVRWVKPGRKS